MIIKRELIKKYTPAVAVLPYGGAMMTLSRQILNRRTAAFIASLKEYKQEMIKLELKQPFLQALYACYRRGF